MGVATKHVLYDEWISEWEKCRDCIDGQKAVKSRGIRYLPKLSDQTESEYDAYRMRALFYSITGKSNSALVGMVINKLPILKYPKELAYLFEEHSGVQFYETWASATSENLLMGRFGLMVDRPLTGGKVEIVQYKVEDILNWEVDRQDKLYYVVLREVVYKKIDDFSVMGHIQYRHLKLVPGASVGFPDMELVYAVDLYDDKEVYDQTIVPLNTGRPMAYIPFIVVNPLGVGSTVYKPPMLDIADVNLSHYRSSADLEHGRHFTGLPTVVVTGVDGSQKLKIGSQTAWCIPDKDAKATFLEFTGQGLQSLEKALSEKENQLASLSARILGNSGNGSEAADTVRLRYMSETASLSTITRAVEAGLNIVYKIAAEMDGMDPNDVSIKLDKEFLSVRMSPSELIKLTESYLTGGMTVETYVYNLRRGDLLPVTSTDEQEIKALEEMKALIDEAAAKTALPKPQPSSGPTAPTQ